MKILIVIGARPNFMKAAPIISAIRQHNAKVGAIPADRRESLPEAIQHVLVHTGQHYDDLMSGTFFRDLDLPIPDVHLGVGSASHAVQTAEIMKKFEQIAMTEKPDVVVVVGDVNSTIACALVTAKVSFDSAGGRPLIAHVEAGLRSFDRAMPEEINRVLTDHLSDLLFVTEASGLQNLCREGIPADRIHFVGNTMIDSLLALKDKAEASSILEELGLRSESGRLVSRYALLTLHRPSNVDDRNTFLGILSGLKELAADCPIIFPVHPRTQQRSKEFGFESFRLATAKRNGNGAGSLNGRKGIIFTEPLGYLDFLSVMKHAELVVTDSGGIQEETTCLGIPCVTVRENTERPVTVAIGTNALAGTSPESIRNVISRQLMRKIGGAIPEKWDGHAAGRIVDVLVRTRSVVALSPTAASRNGRKPDCWTIESADAAVA